MKSIIIAVITSVVFFIIGWRVSIYFNVDESLPSVTPTVIIPKPLEKYTIENLSKTNINSGKFKLYKSAKESDKFLTKIFYYDFNPDPEKLYIKTITGQINIPKEDGLFPILIMLRGYIDQTLYKTGDGTRNSSNVFAENGYITIAPDFLGYGESDQESEDIFETRFQTYTTVLSLIKSVDQIEKWNGKDIFLWGHSNGGHVALTILEITQGNYPTTLWAPVSAPFPYSILYYTDDSDDRGKLIRKELAEFENLYDVEKYSLDNYLDKIKATIQIHQGTEDELVPQKWSDALVNKLQQSDIDVDYYSYSVADHNLRPFWENVIDRDLAFFEKHKSTK